MTISGNGCAATGAGVNNLALSSGTSLYREVDGDQREKIQAAGRRFGELTGGNACLVLVGRILGRGDPGGADRAARTALLRGTVRVSEVAA